MSNHSIHVSHLKYRHRRFELRGVDLQVPRGFITGFAGPNGAGKTTTIKAILGLIRPSGGTITVLNGRAPSDSKVREKIGVVFDRPTVAPEWSVDSIGKRLAPFYRGWDSRQFEALLDKFDVPRGQRSHELSRGQGVKLSLAMAMAHNPELLVLDEPSTGLDPVSRAELADHLRYWMTQGERSILFSTHITAELDNLADFVHIIHDGQIVVSGQLDELQERFAVARAVGAAPESASSALIGLRQDSDRWDALIHASDTAQFGAEVIIDTATTDDIVVYFARQGPRKHSDL